MNTWVSRSTLAKGSEYIVEVAKCIENAPALYFLYILRTVAEVQHHLKAETTNKLVHAT